MRVHRAGIIGLGIMGRRMLGHMAAHPRFAVAGVWDPAEPARARVAREFPDVPIAENADALIGATDAEVVYIACPPLWHGEHARAAAAAGRTVYCEKPLGIDLAASEALVEHLEAAGTPNIVNFVQAGSHAVAKTEADLKDGRLGEIAGAEVIVHFARWPRDWQADAEWLRFREQGGFTREVLSHFVYVVQRLLGPARLAFAQPLYPDDPALSERRIQARLDCGGVPVSILGTSGGSGPDRVELTIHGSKADCRLHDWFGLQISEGGDWRPAFPEIADLRAAAFVRQLDNAAAFLDGEPHAMPSARDALGVQVLIEAMLAA